jgi:hypothetical protein
MNLVEGLNTRFEIVTSSRTEGGFYLNLYHYFDYLFKNPEFADMYRIAQNEYHKKFGDIWNEYNTQRQAYLDSGRTIESPQITTQPSEVSRMEKADMYCMAVGSEVRIYYPIKHFHECDTPDDCGDYNGMLLLYGLDYTLKKYKDYYRVEAKHIKSTYKNWYKNERDFYQGELSQFHMMFTARYEEQKGSIVVPTSNEISFDEKNGLLILGNKTVRVKRQAEPPVEYHILQYMNENDGFGEKAFFSEILEDKFGEPKENFRKILRACQSLEKKIKEDAGLENILTYGAGEKASVRLMSRL